MATPLRAKIFAGVLIALILGMMVSCGLELARATETSARSNVFGAVPYTANPYIYNVGSISGARIVDEDNLQVEINPLGTFQQYVETVQFCGNPQEMFRDKGNLVVLTYTRSAPRIIEGRACHQLIRVDSLAHERIQQ